MPWLAAAVILVFLPDLIRPGNPELAERLGGIVRTGMLVLGVGLLLLFLVAGFGIWLWRRRAIARLPRQLVDASEVVLSDPRPYRAAGPGEFPQADMDYYRNTQASFERLGYRLVGDAVDAVLAETTHKPEALSRCLLSVDGTRLVHFIKIKQGYFLTFAPVVEMAMESEDGRFFILTATPSVDYSPQPPEIHQTFLPVDTAPEALTEAFEQALPAYLEEHPDFVPRRHGDFSDVLASLERLSLCHARYRSREGFYTARDYAAAKAAGLDEAGLELVFSSYHREKARRARERGESNVDDGSTRPWLPRPEENAPSPSNESPKEHHHAYRTLALAIVTSVLVAGAVMFAATVPRWVVASLIQSLRPPEAYGLPPEAAAVETLIAAMSEDDRWLFHQPGSVEDAEAWRRFADRHTKQPAYAWWAFRQIADSWFNAPAGHDVSLWRSAATDPTINRNPALDETTHSDKAPAAVLADLLSHDPDNGGVSLFAAAGLARSGVAVAWVHLPDPHDAENRKMDQRFVVLKPDDARETVRWLHRAARAPRLDFRLDELQRERLRAFGRPDGWCSVTVMGRLLNRNAGPEETFWEDFAIRWIGLAAARLELPRDDLFDPFYAEAKAAGLVPVPPAALPPSPLSLALPGTGNAAEADGWSAYEMLLALQTVGAHILRDNAQPEAQRVGLTLVSEAGNRGAPLLRAAGRDAEASALLARGVRLIHPEVVDRLGFLLALRHEMKTNPDPERGLVGGIDIDEPMLLSDATALAEAEAMVAAGEDSWSRNEQWRRNRYFASFFPRPYFSTYGPSVDPADSAPMRGLDVYSGQLLFWYICLVGGWLWLALETSLYCLYSREKRRYPSMTSALRTSPWAPPGRLLFMAGAVAVLGLGLPALALHAPGAPTAVLGLGGTGIPNIVWGCWLGTWSAMGIAGVTLLLGYWTWRWSLRQGDSLLAQGGMEADEAYRKQRRRYAASAAILCGFGLFTVFAWCVYSLTAPERGAGLWIAVFIAGFLLLMGAMFGVLAGTELNRRPYTIYRLCRHRYLLPMLAVALGVWMLAYPFHRERQRACMENDTLILPRSNDSVIAFPRYSGMAADKLRAHVRDALALEEQNASASQSESGM